MDDQDALYRCNAPEAEVPSVADCFEDPTPVVKTNAKDELVEALLTVLRESVYNGVRLSI